MMLFTKKKNTKCLLEAIKHLELNLVDRKEHKDVRFRPIQNVDDLQEGNELVIEYRDFYYQGSINTLSIPLNKDLIYDEETYVNYIYNSIYFGIYKKIAQRNKLNIHYKYSFTTKGYVTIHFLIVIDDEQVIVLPEENNHYYKITEKKLRRNQRTSKE